MNFYKSAALALDHLDRHQGSVKGSLTAAGIQTQNTGEAKRVLALLIETLKFRPVLQQLLETTNLQFLEKITFPRKTPPRTPTSNSLILVLLHDLLFSSRARIEASDKWPPKEAILRHQARLKAELVRIQIKSGKQSKSELARIGTEGVERYVRWNPNTDLHRSGDWSLAALHAHLTKKGFEKVGNPVWPVPSGKYFEDEHLGEWVLVFPGASTWWVGDEWYEAGAVVLQDKASCFPAKVLMQGWKEDEGECIDATAAPGNKTSYVSALMDDKSTVYAFERSQGRYTTLEKMLSKANCKNVKPTCGDFTETDPTGVEHQKVTRILLDPSCSGSGIVNRLDYLVEDENADEADVKAERLEKLAAFQLQMILHAFKFSSVQRIVYSTCSIHPEEDEQVVMKALASPTAKSHGWALAQREEVLPAWHRRGRPEETNGEQELADGMIRCMPGEDKTNGFFVACFVKASSLPQKQKTPKSASKKRLRDAEGAQENERAGGLKEKQVAVERSEAGQDDEGEGDEEKEEEGNGGMKGGKVELKEAKAKTDAQKARKRRKKQAQKDRS